MESQSYSKIREYKLKKNKKNRKDINKDLKEIQLNTNKSIAKKRNKVYREI